MFGTKVFGRVFVSKKAALSQQFVLMRSTERLIYTCHPVFRQRTEITSDLYRSPGYGLDVSVGHATNTCRSLVWKSFG